MSTSTLLPLYVATRALLVTAGGRAQVARRRCARRLAGEAGQTTAEYALVLLGAAAIALLLVVWATKTDRVGKLFDFVLEHITGRVR